MKDSIFDKKTTSKPTVKEILSVVLLALLAGSMAKLPYILSIDEEFFYPRNIGFIIFPALAAYVDLKKRLSLLKVISTGLVFILFAIYINLLPKTLSDDMLMLVCIHLLVL
ncbi:hypothetical protein [Psychroflexus aurantiacus]|uniref:hypothetical protein n=1 Tax=Psychroflexus aurantiacus TaxID=2709310 RepID=UPI001967B1A1|nr:hypothetical protein [Psychroflexus aurantiacus]